MEFQEITRLPAPPANVKADVRQVVREVANKRQIFVRVRLSGWHFPERAPEPFMVVGRTVSKFVRIGPDGTFADAYFDVMPPKARQVSFGYGKTIVWDFNTPVDPKTARPLDRARLPKGVVSLRKAWRSR